MKQAYQKLIFKSATRALIEYINGILAEYEAQGFVLTVRQLYYQLVARDIVPNTEKSYKNIGRIVNAGRLAGMIDWDMIEDRTRAFKGLQRYAGPDELLLSCEHSYHEDMWDTQDCRVFCIVEKDALFGVLRRVCAKWDVPLLAARGYPSSSVLREFVLEQVIPNSHQIIVWLHLGDHDPSGLDMSRDLKERLMMFCGGHVTNAEFRRLALNMDQIEEIDPPPNPAKESDSRFGNYLAMYGEHSWELDALEPQYIEKLVDAEVSQFVNMENWKIREQQIEDVKMQFGKVRDNWDRQAEIEYNARIAKLVHEKFKSGNSVPVSRITLTPEEILK